MLEVQHKIDFLSVPFQSFAGIININIYISYIHVYIIYVIYVIYVHIYTYIYIYAKYLAIFEEIIKSLTKKILHVK